MSHEVLGRLRDFPPKREGVPALRSSTRGLDVIVEPLGSFMIFLLQLEGVPHIEDPDQSRNMNMEILEASMYYPPIREGAEMFVLNAS